MALIQTNTWEDESHDSLANAKKATAALEKALSEIPRPRTSDTSGGEHTGTGQPVAPAPGAVRIIGPIPESKREERVCGKVVSLT